MADACNEGDLARVKLALNGGGANIDSFSNTHKFTPLLLAAGLGHIEIVKYLLEQGALVDGPLSCMGFESHALHAAVFEKQIEVVKYLIDKKANVNAFNVHGSAPLHVAAGGHSRYLAI